MPGRASSQTPPTTGYSLHSTHKYDLIVVVIICTSDRNKKTLSANLININQSTDRALCHST